MILLWIALGVAGVLLAALLTGAAAGLYGAHKIFARRYNGNPDVRYFRAEDFEGLSAEPVSFDSGGVALRGYVYTREGEKKGAVIFSHGFGAGHAAYTTEIDRMTRSGFAVLAFDNAACAESGGSALKGFDGGVADLLAAVKFSRTHPLLKDLPKSMFGHSWGGFSVINAFPQCDDVGFAAAMCGFVGCGEIIGQTIFGKIAPLRFAACVALRLRERSLFGKCANYRSDKAVRKIRKPLFLLYGEKDGVVPYRWNGKKVIAAAKGNPFVTSVSFAEKGHNVYLTEEAERYMNETFGRIGKIAKKDKAAAQKLYHEVDYAAMTREDEAVMSAVTDFLEGKTNGAEMLGAANR